MGWRGMDWECGISRCKVVYIGWRNNQFPLCSTRNYIQHPVISQDGKYDKEGMYMSISSCHVWMRELDHKVGRALKN